MNAEIKMVDGVPSPSRPDLCDEATRRQLGPAGWKASRRVMEIWHVSADQQRQLLVLPPGGTLDDFDPAQLGPDQMLRISYLMGIAKALRILYRGEFADEWVNRPNTNPVFSGHTPLAYMLEGGMDALRNVRRLLDARCAGN